MWYIFTQVQKRQETTLQMHFEQTFRRQNLHRVAQSPNNENLVFLHEKQTWYKKFKM